ncbi:MAG: glycosyltransferase family 4 protein [Myxococcota bacterium]
MHVLYLHQHFVGPQQAGATRSFEMARRLVARGHRVTMLGTIRDRDSGSVRRERLEGIELHRAVVPYDNAMGVRARLQSFAHYGQWASRELMRHRPDVVFATSTPLTVAIPGLWGRLWHRVPMVFEVRDLWPELPIAIGALRSPWSRGAARALAWAAYRGAAEVVALSPGMAEGVAAWGVPRERITTIPNGCDCAAFEVEPARAQADRARRFPDLGPDDPLVMYAGTLGWMNDVGWLVDVAAAMAGLDPRVGFAIVGEGAQRAEIAARVERAGLAATVRLRPAVPKCEVPALLAGATVTTSLFRDVPQMAHNSANKLFDGLAAGRPVAINYGGWQAAMLRETGAGLVVPRSPAAAARQLRAFVREPAGVTAAGAAARTLARERFDRDDQARALEAVLQRAVARFGRATPKPPKVC